MTAEQYLGQIRKFDAMLANMREEYRQLEERYRRLVGLSSGLGDFSVTERVQSSRNLQQIPDAIAGYIDIERDLIALNRRIEALKQKREDIIRTIEQLPTIEYKIIYNFFVKVEPSTMKELAYSFGRSYDWVKKHKRKGMKIVQRILDGEEATVSR